MLENAGVVDIEMLAGALCEETQILDQMSENVIGAFRLPMGVLTGILVNGHEHRVAMATEEPSVVAAVNRTARMLNEAGGVHVTVDSPVTFAQIMVVCEKSAAQAVCNRILANKERYLALANACDDKLVQCGGGAFKLAVRTIDDERILLPDGSAGCDVVVRLEVHTVDAMGANAVNTMAEALLKSIVADTGCIPGMAILSNAGDGRLAHARTEIPFDILGKYARMNGEQIAHRIEMASIFAENDPQRAVTHNKGILNGVSAAALVLGQDTRALEVSIIDYACRLGGHKPLSRWFVRDAGLCGELTLPLMVGVVGGFRRNPAMDAAFSFDGIDSYTSLCSVLSAVGLAQNLGAVWALVTDGIQAGHMVLHARKM